MYNKQSKSVIAKIGKITISLNRTSIMIRFTHEGKRYEFAIGTDSTECRKKAKDIAHQIERDIYHNEFDTTCLKYGKKSKNSDRPILAIIQTEKLNLLSLWNQFKEFKIKTNSVERTTVNGQYKQVERCLAKIGEEFYEFENANFLLEALLEHYSSGTLDRVLTDINACANWAVECQKLDKNPYAKLKKHLGKQPSSRAYKIFEPQEIGYIITAFKDNQFNADKSAYEHSYYADYVHLLALTGFRPEEAIALTWNDFKERDNRIYISVTKAYTRTILKGTKTGETRLFPCNDELANLIDSLPRKHETLVFPSQEGVYIHQGNFLRRYWKPVIEGLVKQRKVEKYLPAYNLRHSFITYLVRTNHSIDVIAVLAGTSRETIFKHYLGKTNVENIQLPNSKIRSSL